MTSPKKTLDRLLRGTSDANLRFNDVRTLLLALGFDERIRGSHHIFRREDIDEILTLQPKGSKAKPYQAKQIRQVINKYRLGNHGEE